MSIKTIKERGDFIVNGDRKKTKKVSNKNRQSKSRPKKATGSKNIDNKIKNSFGVKRNTPNVKPTKGKAQNGKKRELSDKELIERRREIRRKKNLEIKRIKARRKKFFKIIMTVIITIVMSIVLAAGIFNIVYLDNDKIAKNMYINDIDVSDMEIDEAREALSKEFKLKDLVFSYDGKKYTIDSEKVDLSYDIEDVVKEAYDYTRGGSYLENLTNYLKLKEKRVDKTITVEYNNEKMVKELGLLSEKINKEPKSAEISVDGGHIKVTKSVDGKKVNIDENLKLVKKSIDKSDKTPIKLSVETTKPEYTTEELSKIDTKLGEYKTEFASSNDKRIHNIKKAAEATDKIILESGEQFSYNNLTGKTNAENGYQDAKVMINGELVESPGGGVCQTSSTIFNAAVLAGMKIDVVKNHSASLKYVPIGRDATVTDSGQDFKFTNAYENAVYIRNYIEGKSIKTVIYGSKNDKKNIEITADIEKIENGEIKFDTYRIYKDSSGKEIDRERISGGKYRK